MGRILYWTEKWAYIGIAAVAIIGFYILFKEWGDEKVNYFLFTGDLESAATVFLIICAVAFAFKKLWKWEIREIFRPKHGPARGRR
ncbi:MAG TPA: hypothetical protein HA254_06015 [Candidatus Diapherotrites archaeon]|uniref:Uncharacterized protein n=1 Tax=Candidatus Iainarchaeum sp. TaxID=3101447 RepID=A0A7J4IXG6_9ARCH|nr:hypothetical protein [Candidatus Diapherotrites archaeon]